jgi:hypothetical protein
VVVLVVKVHLWVVEVELVVLFKDVLQYVVLHQL